MAFLNSARRLVNESDSLVVRLSGDKDGAIKVLIEPQVKLPQPETDDAELAALQAALAMPLVIRFTPDTADLDAALGDALRGMAQARVATVGALASYEEAQAEARNQAQIAAQAKAKKPATKASAPATAAKATSAPTTASAAPLPAAAAPAADAEPRAASEATAPATVQDSSAAVDQPSIFD